MFILPTRPQRNKETRPQRNKETHNALEYYILRPGLDFRLVKVAIVIISFRRVISFFTSRKGYTDCNCCSVKNTDWLVLLPTPKDRGFSFKQLYL